MNVCIIGSGGRESALAWKISQSSNCDQLYILPGNGGNSTYSKNIELDINRFEDLVNFLVDNKIDMLIVGPEAPLVEGMTDSLNKVSSLEGLKIVGPGKEGAMLEGSKAFAKEFMKEFNIPTASYAKFALNDLEKAYKYLDNSKAPYVLKADGLAAGKGVVILDNLEDAKKEIKDMLSGKFGSAGNTVVIEEFLDGIEFSVFVVTDGISYQILPEAKDYKRRFEGDKGLNTGGMGAVSPVPFVDENLMQKVEEKVIKPTVKGIQSRGMDYKGFIFFGLINVKGEPKVIEYNCRMGDPESEVVIPRIKSDFLGLLKSVFDESLANNDIELDPRTAATVMLVSEGYPGSYNKGQKITGLEEIKSSIVFHAGTKSEGNDILSNGGRVLAVTSLNENMNTAINTSMENIEKIDFEGKRFRTDIGFDL